MSLNPDVIGWQEFLLRVCLVTGFTAWVLLVFLMALTVALKMTLALLGLLDGNPHKARRAPVYVSEYEGQPSGVHASPETARNACARLLRQEAGPEPRWDWISDGYGWSMYRLDAETDRPAGLLAGRVTRAVIEP